MPEQLRRMQVRDVTAPIEAVCRQFLADRGIPALYLHELTRPLLDEVHALLDRHGGEVREQATADAIEGWKRKWSVQYPDGYVLGKDFTEAGARQCAADTGGQAVYQLVAPSWQPADGGAS